MRFLKNIIQRLIRDDKKVMGRWHTESCNVKMNTKIDMANEDHCGPCGQYIIDKTPKGIAKEELSNLQSISETKPHK